MEEEDINTPEQGTDIDLPESDTDINLDWYDPDEEEPDTQTEEPEVSTDEGDGEEATDDQAEEETPVEILIDLPDGTKVSREEAIKGYLRQSDYTRKAQELSERRKSLESESTTLSNIAKAFFDHLKTLMPPEPDPALALRDPNAYVKAKAQYDAASAQVQKLWDIGTESKQITETLTTTDKKARLAEENRALAMKFPEVANPQGREKFFSRVADVAQEIGYSLDDLSAVDDHRLYVLAHWAAEGMKAAKSRQVAKQKVEAAPVTPKKPGRPTNANRNAEAMKRFMKTGSINDAAKVEWN